MSLVRDSRVTTDRTELDSTRTANGMAGAARWQERRVAGEGHGRTRPRGIEREMTRANRTDSTKEGSNVERYGRLFALAAARSLHAGTASGREAAAATVRKSVEAALQD